MGAITKMAISSGMPMEPNIVSALSNPDEKPAGIIAQKSLPGHKLSVTLPTARRYRPLARCGLRHRLRLSAVSRSGALVTDDKIPEQYKAFTAAKRDGGHTTGRVRQSPSAIRGCFHSICTVFFRRVASDARALVKAATTASVCQYRCRRRYHRVHRPRRSPAQWVQPRRHAIAGRRPERRGLDDRSGDACAAPARYERANEIKRRATTSRSDRADARLGLHPTARAS